MKAVVLEYGELKLKEMPDPEAGAGEVTVRLKAAGLNRRDLYIPARRGSDKEALILGSDGAGIVEAVGEGVTAFSEGDEVLINPALRWFENSAAPPAEFDILGMPDHGTFAEKIAISADQLEKKPKHLSFEEASTVALSAMTGWRALVTKGRLQKGSTVFIPGAGGGVATFLIQFAKNLGARVIVSSRSEEKCREALSIGADRAIPTGSDWNAELQDETVDLVIESVGRATFNRSLNVLKKGGRIVTFGSTTEDVIEFDLRKFFYGQYELVGSTMGCREELREVLDHMELHGMKPELDSVYGLDEFKAAFERLEENRQFGKIAFRL